MKNLISQYGGMKREIYILFIGKLVTAMGSFVWPVLTFFLTKRLHMSDSNATLLIATASIVSLPAALLGGKLADKFSRKWLIIIFDIATVSLYTLAAILPSSYITVGLVFFAGLFQTIESPAYDALVADFSTSEQREQAYALNYLGYNVGFIIGASVSGLLFQRHLWLAFLLNGAAILVSTLLILFFVHQKNAVGEDTENKAEAFTEYEMPVDDKRSVLSILKERKVLILMLLVGCFASLPSNVVGILLPLQLKETMGDYGAEIYGYLSSVNGLVVTVFTPVFTLLLKKFTEIPKVILGLLLFVSGIALFSPSSAIWVLFVGMFVFTLGEVVTVLGQNPYQSRRIPASHRGRVGGLTSVVFSLFSSATQYLISFILFLTDSNYQLIGVIFIVCGLIAAGMYALLYPMDRRTFPKLYKH